MSYQQTKRRLTEDEMYDICDFIKIDPEKDWETSVAVANNVRDGIIKQLQGIELYPSKIPQLKKKIEEYYHQSRIDPGQAVGVDAALGIGEPTTQLSTFKHEKVIVRTGSKIINTTIGAFIDGMINDSQIIFTDDYDSTFVPFSDDENWEIMSVSQNEQVRWSKITELSRHLPHGNLVKVTTASGRENISTLSHSFLKRTKNGKIVPVKGSDLVVGDRIPVCKRIGEFENQITEINGPNGDMIKMTRDWGEFLGIFISEGSTCKSSNNVVVTSSLKYYQSLASTVYSSFSDNKITIREKKNRIINSKKIYTGFDTVVSCKQLSIWLRENCGTYSNNKHIPAFVFGCEKWFIACVLRSLFDGDGNINVNRKSVKYHSTSKDLIEQVALLLAYFGIFCSYHIDRHARSTIFTGSDGEEKESEQQDLWCILIYGPVNGKIFREEIGTNIPKKMEALEEYTVDFDPSKTKEELDQIPFVADLISKIGRGLKLPGASRNYGRWVTKEENGLCIGRQTLIKYVHLFTESDTKSEFTNEIALLKQAVDSDVVWDRIVSLEVIEPEVGDYVYDFSVAIDETFTLQSGIIVHNTMNSIDYEDCIVVKKGNNVYYPKIGEFIDELMTERKSKIQVYDNVTDYVDINDLDWETSCVDEDGKMSWKRIEAVTRHPPPEIKSSSDNEDIISANNLTSARKLLKVTTQTGRVVTATKSKSFLTRQNNKVIGTKGSDIKVGDRIPVTIFLPRPCNDKLTELKVSDYLSKKTYVFGTELWKAREIRDYYKQNGRKARKYKTCVPVVPGRATRWWDENYDSEFSLPYKRSDAAMDALEGKKKEMIGNEKIKYGCVYTLHKSVGSSDIPEIIPLDNDFGFFVGAYLAEGHCVNTDYQLIISNNDKKFRDRIQNWCDRYNIGYHLQVQNDKNFKGATSSDFRIHSLVLVDLFKSMCGNLSHMKYIPSFTLSANDDFLRGLIDGYFSGDGCVTLDKGITCSSTSEQMIDGISNILNLFGIFCVKSSNLHESNNIGSKNILRAWILSIRAGNLVKFCNTFSFTIDYKQERSNVYKTTTPLYKYYIHDYISGINTPNFQGSYKREDLISYVNKGVDSVDINELVSAIDSDVLFDEIISIEEVDSTREMVYDLTVADTRNFMLRNGLNVRDKMCL